MSAGAKEVYANAIRDRADQPYSIGERLADLHRRLEKLETTEEGRQMSLSGGGKLEAPITGYEELRECIASQRQQIDLLTAKLNALRDQKEKNFAYWDKEIEKVNTQYAEGAAYAAGFYARLDRMQSKMALMDKSLLNNAAEIRSRLEKLEAKTPREIPTKSGGTEDRLAHIEAQIASMNKWLSDESVGVARRFTAHNARLDKLETVVTADKAPPEEKASYYVCQPRFEAALISAEEFAAERHSVKMMFLRNALAYALLETHGPGMANSPYAASAAIMLAEAQEALRYAEEGSWHNVRTRVVYAGKEARLLTQAQSVPPQWEDIKNMLAAAKG